VVTLSIDFILPSPPCLTDWRSEEAMQSCPMEAIGDDGELDKSLRAKEVAC
jgi:hypothetical protein